MSDSELKPLKAISIARTAAPFASSKSTRDRDLSPTHTKQPVLSGWLAVAFFKKSAARGSFVQHRQH